MRWFAAPLTLLAMIALPACPDPASSEDASTGWVDAASADADVVDATASADAAAGNDAPGSDAASDDAATADAADADAASPDAGGAPGDICQKPMFPPGAPWNQDISQAAVDSQSAEVITWLDGAGGWGNGAMQIDFSIEVLCAEAGTALRTFTKTANFWEGECDHEPVPVPTGGAIEGYDDYECTSGGDCHLIVIERSTGKLFEIWTASISGGQATGGEFTGGCMAVWDLGQVPPDDLRGDQCSSADAAGLPIAPLLFDADEVAAGEINHAIRFILPNARIRHRTYVRPATHATGAASGGDSAPPYGIRLRLRSDYPLGTLPNEAARVVARAMQRYGIILADGGNIALTAQSDRFTTAGWDGLLGPHDLNSLQVTDFEMVEAGTRYQWTGDCTLNP